jgi:hypothetical protein
MVKERNMSSEQISSKQSMQMALNQQSLMKTLLQQIQKLENIIQKQKEKGEANAANVEFYSGILNSLYSCVMLDETMDFYRKQNQMLKSINKTINDENAFLKLEVDKYVGVATLDIDRTIDVVKSAVKTKILAMHDLYNRKNITE